jgi:ribA/ribD-fused uncharacterized protein
MTDTTITSFTGEHRFLSNFYSSPVPYDGKTWRTAEHAYQAMKANDWEYRDGIWLLPTPGEAKRAGQLAVLRPGWDKIKKAIMLEIVIAKFRCAPFLAQRLAATSDATLVESNAWHDNYWGDCRCGRDLECSIPGQNALGVILEAVRFTVS